MSGRRPTRCCAFRNRTPIGLSTVPASLRVVKQMFFSMMIDGYIEEKSRAITHSYSPGSRLWTYPPSMDFPPEPARGELRVLHAVLQDLLPVPGPLLLHVDAVHVVLPFPEEQPAHRVEGLLLRAELELHRPPRVRDDAAMGPPEPLPDVADPLAVPGKREVRDAVDPGPLLQDREVVAVDVVPGDHVRVRLRDEVDEPPDDLLLVPGEDVGLDCAVLPPREAEAEDRGVLDRVLDVKRDHLQLRRERLAGLEPLRLHHEFRGVVPLRRDAVDADARAEVHVVDEPVGERDVRREHPGTVLAGPRPGPGRLPGVLQGHLRARRLAALDPELHGPDPA